MPSNPDHEPAVVLPLEVEQAPVDTANEAIKAALSAPRFATYEAATQGVPALAKAVALYTWNAQLSAALMYPLHVCEVAIRNAVSDALTAVYGEEWPWSPGFVASLPNPPSPTFSPKRDLLAVRAQQATTGKVIAELKFKFWESMFTGRFDARLWNHHLHTVLPFSNSLLTVQDVRKQIRDDLESLRGLRNRIAHHEPIFARNLSDDYQKAYGLIALRCAHTAAWMKANESATTLIGAKPT